MSAEQPQVYEYLRERIGRNDVPTHKPTFLEITDFHCPVLIHEGQTAAVGRQRNLPDDPPSRGADRLLATLNMPNLNMTI
jgi:hypothetical protein